MPSRLRTSHAVEIASGYDCVELGESYDAIEIGYGAVEIGYDAVEIVYNFVNIEYDAAPELVCNVLEDKKSDNLICMFVCVCVCVCVYLYIFVCLCERSGLVYACVFECPL